MAAIRMSIAAGAVSLVGLTAQAAEPVVPGETQPARLSDAQLDSVTGGIPLDPNQCYRCPDISNALPDIAIWDIDGSAGPGGPVPD